jgi:2,3-bisphosphoglycerate-dependent phosphoglycerate mutase
MTAERTLPYFKEDILKHLNEGKNVLVSAHGNSLRSIVMHIENISKENIVKLEIQTGIPRTYEFQNNIFTKIE